MEIGFRLRAIAIALILVMAAACGTDDGARVRAVDEGKGAGSASGPGTGSSGSGAQAALDPATADTRVNVTLREWSIAPQPAEVRAGAVAFEVKNEGSVLHEVVVLRAPDVGSLPVMPDGTADEAKLGAENGIGEIEVPAGQTGTVAFQMKPGNYVLICNVLDEHGAHFKQQMHTSFKVA